MSEIEQAANALKAAVSEVERMRIVVDSAQKLLKGCADGLKRAELIERNAEIALVRLSGGRYWDFESGTLKVDA